MKKSVDKKITYRFDDFCINNQLSQADYNVLKSFLDYYDGCDMSQQIRINEMLGKLLKKPSCWKKSTGRQRPKWFPWDKIDHCVADHCERYRIDGVDSIVCHPYGLHPDSLKEVNMQCEKHNLTYYIDGSSNYFLGVTPRIVFQKK